MILNTLLSRDLLIDAYKFYSRGDARAHDALNIIINRNDMTSAVQGCLEQSIKEEEPKKQNLYIQAACFGKKYYPGVAIEEYPSTCRRLRVMNILRDKNIDPNSSIETSLDMLVSWREFALALWIVEYLGIDGEEKIRRKWSEYLIEQHQLSDDQVAERVQKILGPNPVVSYAEIANKAIDHHRIQLAIKLIEHEGQSLKQIPLLLSLKQYDLVLAQALASCDSNLIYMAIFKLKELMPSEIPFLELLKKHKLAFKYYCNFLAFTDIQKLIMICQKENPTDELILSFLQQYMDSSLIIAKKIRRDIIIQQIDTCIKLDRIQQSFEKSIEAPPKTKQHWTNLSISDTIINLIALGHTGKAKDIQRRFDVTDRKYKTLEQIALNTLPKLSI